MVGMGISKIDGEFWMATPKIQSTDIDTVYQVIFHYYGSRLPK